MNCKERGEGVMNPVSIFFFLFFYRKHVSSLDASTEAMLMPFAVEWNRNEKKNFEFNKKN
jgi:hypothetical protein